jgi:hypothetical protein
MLNLKVLTMFDASAPEARPCYSHKSRSGSLKILLAGFSSIVIIFSLSLRMVFILLFKLWGCIGPGGGIDLGIWDGRPIIPSPTLGGIPPIGGPIIIPGPGPTRGCIIGFRGMARGLRGNGN